MIRLGTMTSVCPNWDLDQIVEGMRRHGYEGLEPRVGWGHAAGIELDSSPSRRQAVRERFAKEGLAISCVACSACFALPDPGELEGSVSEATVSIDLAADLGAPYVRTFGGARGEGEVYPIVKRTAEAYKRVTDHAAERNVTLLMETHDNWCVSAQVRAVVEEVDHPNLRVLWDLMHPQRMMERSDETMRTIGHLTAHLHAHDGRYEMPQGRLANVGLGDGVIDHATPLRLLNDAGFDGFFSVEVIHKPGSDHDADGVLGQYAEGFREIVAGF